MNDWTRVKWNSEGRGSGRKVELFYSCMCVCVCCRSSCVVRSSDRFFFFFLALPFRVPNSNYIILYEIIFRFCIFCSPLLLLFNLFQLLFAYLCARHYFYSTMRRLQHTVSFSVFFFLLSSLLACVRERGRECATQVCLCHHSACTL